MMPGLWIGHDLADEQALVNLKAVLVSLHAIVLGGEFGLRRQDVRPACCGLPEKRIDAHRPRVSRVSSRYIGTA